MNKPLNLDPNKYANDPLAQKLLKEQRELVKNAIDPVFLNEEYDDLRDDLIAGNYIAIEGEPQTGKTMAAIKAFTDLGIPCMVINFSKAIRPTEWLAEKTLKTGTDREIVLVEKDVVICAKNDYGVIINEWTTAMAEDTQKLLEVLDTTTDQITLPDGSHIKKGENFRVIVTSNPNCEGNFAQNDATLTRFVHYTLSDIDSKGFLAMAKRHHPWLSDKFINTAYSLCAATIAEAKQKTGKKISVGIRQLDYLMNSLGARSEREAITEHVFLRKAAKALINPLYRKGYQLEQLELFKNNPTVQSHLKEMFKEYQKSAPLKGRPLTEIQAAQKTAEPEKSETASAGDRFSKYRVR